MAEGMFGAPVGFRLAEQDIDASNLRQAQTLEAIGRIAMQPAQEDVYRQHGRLYGAQADLAAEKTRQALRLTETVRGITLPSDPVEASAKLAEMQAGVGALEDASQTLHRSSQIVNQLAQAGQHRATRDKTQIEEAHKEVEAYAGIMRNSRDQATFDRNNALFELAYNRPSPFKGMTYDPESVKALNDSVTGARDVLNAEVRRIETDQRERADADRNRYREAMTEVRNRRVANEEEREKRLGKAGGGARVGFPTMDERGAVSRMIKKDVNIAGDELAMAVDTIGSRARELQRANPALGFETAAQQAFREAQAAGEFEETEGVDLPLIGKVGVRTKFKRKDRAPAGAGKTPESALPMPATKEEMKAGMYYNTSRGMAKWNGTAFEPVK